jgi:hypothetical protein
MRARARKCPVSTVPKRPLFAAAMGRNDESKAAQPMGCSRIALVGFESTFMMMRPRHDGV